VSGWVFQEANANAGLNASILLGQIPVEEKGWGKGQGRREMQVRLWCRSEPSEGESQGRLGGSVLDCLAKPSGVLRYINAVESTYLWDVA